MRGMRCEVRFAGGFFYSRTSHLVPRTSNLSSYLESILVPSILPNEQQFAVFRQRPQTILYD